MAKSLVIVESPTKAKTIGKYLGSEFEVKASYGHVRDLPNKAAEIPEKFKKEKWATLGIDVTKDFEPIYVIPEDKKKRVKDLKSSLKEASVLYLATDEDREGESISWHLLQVLKPKIPVKRLVFNQITKNTIQKAFDNTREVDDNLVRAQETRRIIDRLFGYSVSPLLWRKMAPRLSAGRVQSVATRLLVERERLRMSFVSADYWDLAGKCEKEGTPPPFEVKLVSIDGKRVAIGKDFNPNTGKLKENADVVLLDEKAAKQLCERVTNDTSIVESVDSKPFTTKPYPPFTTSTLQQEGSRKLGFGARRTMRAAQKLYENGYITYMRTDSTSLSNEAVDMARTLIKKQFGDQYLPSAPRVYKTKVKNAQEAHEAIRPAGQEFAPIDKVKAELGAECGRLYELIWKRTVSCQMEDARGTKVNVRINNGNAQFRAFGKVIEFPGYLRAYVEGSDDPEAELADKETLLPSLAEGDALKIKEMEALSHSTQPPSRYTEGSLIKELERLGIGRPSTWATIVDVVLSRDYAFKKGTALVPSFLAIAVTGLMERYFTSVVDYDFTAQLEEDLDSISRGEAEYLNYLKSFYLGEQKSTPGLEELVTSGQENIDPRDVCGISIIPEGSEETLEVRIGRYGPFLSDGTNRASLPDQLPPDELSPEMARQLLEDAQKGPESLGNHPESGKPVYVKTGRYGPYVQEGDPPADKKNKAEKPKMVSLLAGMKVEEVDLETAVKLLSLPRNLGKYPENNEDIFALLGRYGPYIKCGTDSRPIPAPNTPIAITLEEAIEILKQPKTKGRRAAKPPLKELGKHPVTEKPLVIKSGRYGPYITDGKINVSVPKSHDPEEVTLEQAVELIDAKANKVG